LNSNIHYLWFRMIRSSIIDAGYLSRPQKIQPSNYLNISTLQNIKCPCSGH